MPTTFKLHYHISNNGDGSASVNLHDNADQAIAADESMEEGWGEPSAESIVLKVEDGKIFYRTYGYVDGKFSAIWKPCEIVTE